jgi:hypothetical protein
MNSNGLRGTITSVQSTTNFYGAGPIVHGTWDPDGRVFGFIDDPGWTPNLCIAPMSALDLMAEI